LCLINFFIEIVHIEITNIFKEPVFSELHNFSDGLNVEELYFFTGLVLTVVQKEPLEVFMVRLLVFVAQVIELVVLEGEKLQEDVHQHGGLVVVDEKLLLDENEVEYKELRDDCELDVFETVDYRLGP